jgi:hypothetical protein
MGPINTLIHYRSFEWSVEECKVFEELKLGEAGVIPAGLYYHLSALKGAGIIEVASYRETKGAIPEKMWRLRILFKIKEKFLLPTSPNVCSIQPIQALPGIRKVKVLLYHTFLFELAQCVSDGISM